MQLCRLTWSLMSWTLERVKRGAVVHFSPPKGELDLVAMKTARQTWWTQTFSQSELGIHLAHPLGQSNFNTYLRKRFYTSRGWSGHEIKNGTPLLEQLPRAVVWRCLSMEAVFFLCAVLKTNSYLSTYPKKLRTLSSRVCLMLSDFMPRAMGQLTRSSLKPFHYPSPLTIMYPSIHLSRRSSGPDFSRGIQKQLMGSRWPEAHETVLSVFHKEFLANYWVTQKKTCSLPQALLCLGEELLTWTENIVE